MSLSEAAPTPAAAPAGPRTLAFDIGGTRLKAALLDGTGEVLAGPVRTDTPHPSSPEVVIPALVTLARQLGEFDQARDHHGRIGRMRRVGADRARQHLALVVQHGRLQTRAADVVAQRAHAGHRTVPAGRTDRDDGRGKPAVGVTIHLTSPLNLRAHPAR